MKRIVLIAAVVAALLTGCSDPKDQVTIRVLAAQSLSGVFPDLMETFTAKHSRIHISSAFAGSSLLATQIEQGAPADVFISADEATMVKLVTAKLVIGSPGVVTRNKLAIMVGRGNPKNITGLHDLRRGGLRVAMCAAGVPCGTYARHAFAKAGVIPPNASQEANVAGVVTKVLTGEADAGIVYVSDIRAAGTKATGVVIIDRYNVVAPYPAAVLKTSTHTDEAAEFIRFLRSEAAQRILAQSGFAPA